jgi:hypothetical protein
MADERALTEEDVSNMLGDGSWETVDGPAWQTFRDLKAENERLREVLGLCQRTLSLLISPGTVPGYTSATHAYTQCCAAELAARTALATPDHIAG